MDVCIFLGKIDDAISLPPANSDQSSSVNDQFMLISETADLSLWIQLNPAQWLVESSSRDFSCRLIVQVKPVDHLCHFLFVGPPALTALLS